MGLRWSPRAATRLCPQAKSNLSFSATAKAPLVGAFVVAQKKEDSNRAAVNGDPVEPQSRDEALPAGKVESLLLRQKKS